jgi:hypothetical protein
VLTPAGKIYFLSKQTGKIDVVKTDLDGSNHMGRIGPNRRIIAPHADNPEFLGYINHMKKIYKDNDRVMFLKDNQPLVINDNN